MSPAYSKDLLTLLRFPFPGADGITQNYSQAYQDIFVMSAMNGKRDRWFLEVGGADPAVLSNTLLLESVFGWTGLTVERSQEFVDRAAKYPRKIPWLCADALTVDYAAVLEKMNAPRRIDYLSIDIEPNGQTLQCMKQLLGCGLRFSIITFETDYYAGNTGGNSDTVREESRSVLRDNRYAMVVGDVSAFSDDKHPFEDWYLDRDRFSEADIQRFTDTRSPICPEDYIYDRSKAC